MKIWILIVSFFCCLVAQAEQKEVHVILNKIFHHAGVFSDRIICYFSQEPVCKVPEKKAPTHNVAKAGIFNEEVIFFLPYTRIPDKEVRQRIATINNLKNAPYAVKISEVDTPVRGVRVSIMYDSSVIMCDYACGESISKQKSIVFTLHNKQVLNEMKRKTDPLLRSAWWQNTVKEPFKIVVDYGHGGREPGAINSQNIKEKDITLSVGSKIAQLLEQKGYEVILTRQGDRFVALDDRTSLANKKHADLFISIHANSGNNAACGVETYYSCFQTVPSTKIGNDSSCIRIANHVHEKLDTASNFFATCVHRSLLEKINQEQTVCDRGVKSAAIAQVLIGSNMPAALVEIGFLSHPQEGKKLADHQYQQLIAQGICNGIETYYTTILKRS